MPELRRDPIVGRWVIVNIENAMGPGSFEKENHAPQQEQACQFCTGREHQTPPEIEAFRAAGTLPNTPGWNVRVIPNKFPVLRIEGDLHRQREGIYDFTNGIGAHEVIIETSHHTRALADFSSQEVLDVVKKYKSRSLELSKDKRFKYILIFKNFGDSAGASLEHGHSQVIALPMVPKYVLEELEGARSYFELRNRCIFCDVLQQEYQDKERIVTENNGFVVFCPFAPRYPFECWIVPRKHEAQFADISDATQYDLACILKETLFRLKVCLSDPSYNFFFHTSPVNYAEPESYHWHIEVIPKLTRVAGFEWGTGFYVVPTDPAKATKHLRSVEIT